MKNLYGATLAALFAGLVAAGTALAADANSPDSPIARVLRDREILRKQIDKLPLKLIAEANEKAKAFDGKTWLHSVTLDRYMYFVPEPKPPRPGEVILPEPNIIADPNNHVNPWEPPNPPAGAIERHWRDRFALAQQYSYRYRYGGITKLLRKEDMDKPFETTFEIKIKATVRSGLASKVQPVPETPEGMVAWKDERPRWRYGGGGGIRKLELRSPWIPGDPNAKPTNDLERNALAKMRDAPAKTVEGVMICHVVFDAAKGKWDFQSAEYSYPEEGIVAYRSRDRKDWPEPVTTPWSMGLPRGLAGCIYDRPAAKKKADEHTQPAPGEKRGE